MPRACGRLRRRAKEEVIRKSGLYCQPFSDTENRLPSRSRFRSHLDFGTWNPESQVCLDEWDHGCEIGLGKIRQMGGTTEMAAAFQRRQIDGAVMATVRVNAPMRMLVDLADLGIRYSNVVIAASRDYYRRNPDISEAMVRAYLEGVAAVNQQKERTLQVIQKYTRLQDPKLIQDLYADGVRFLERVPRMDAEALAPIVEFMGKKPIPVESIADNSVVNRLEGDGFIDKLYGKR